MNATGNNNDTAEIESAEKVQRGNKEKKYFIR